MWLVAAGAAAAAATGYTLMRKTAAPAPLTEACELGVQGPLKPRGDFGDESAADIKDLQHTTETPVDWPALLRGHMVRLSPYCLDTANARVVLCLANPTDLEDRAYTFYYQAQRVHMQRAFAIPYEEYCSEIEALMRADPTISSSFGHTLFLHSTGRCGSTLFSKLFGELGSTHNLQEPDIYTSHVSLQMLQPELIPAALSNRLLRCSTFMVIEAARRLHPTAKNFVIKTRSFCIMLADAIKTALPECKHMFLYRNAIDTVDSFCMAFFNSRVARLSRKLHIDSLFLFKLTKISEHMPVMAPLMSDSKYSHDIVYRLGACGVTAMIWLSCMDKALRLQRQGFFQAIVRYEDLIVDKMQIVYKVGKLCGLSGTDEAPDTTVRSNALFDEDAHVENSRTASQRRQPNSSGPLFVREVDVADINALLAAHEEIATAEFELPGTVHL